MARYQGRHRPLPCASRPRPVATRASQPAAPAEPSRPANGMPSAKRRVLARPLVAVAAAAGVTFGTLGLATAVNAGRASDAVVGAVLSDQTDELAQAAVVDIAYRTQASVSRSQQRAALAAADAKAEAARAAQAKAAQQAAKAKAAAKARAAAEARAEAAEAAAAKRRAAAVADARQDPKGAARALMAEHGWTSEAQYGCLVNLWNGESAWKWTAQNPSSGAYGIPQSLPARKMAQFGDDYRTNPITQIRWGLWYIDASYGTPCGAWAAWQSRSPHWY